LGTIGLAVAAAAVGLLVIDPARPNGVVGQKDKTHPGRVLIIRHAEKPPAIAKSADLSPKGKERAEILHTLFEKSETRPDPFPVPDFIFATKDSMNSRRPTGTVAPLAEAFKLPVNSEYENRDFGALAKVLFREPKYDGKTVLICWHHGTIPELARSLTVSGAPAEWDDKSFDRVWDITYGERGRATFADRPQKLMPKDTNR
jgi:broad specificity phosphatase PhoE